MDISIHIDIEIDISINIYSIRCRKRVSTGGVGIQHKSSVRRTSKRGLTVHDTCNDDSPTPFQPIKHYC